MKISKDLKDGLPVKGGQGRSDREVYGAAVGAYYGFLMTLALALLVFCVWVLYRTVMG